MILEWGQSQDAHAVLVPGLFPLVGFTGESGAVVVVAEEIFSGGWPIEWPRRKTREEREEEVRQQRIKLGILPEVIDPEVVEPEVVKPKSKVVRLRIPEPWRLSDAELERLRQRITNDIDLEIAVYLREIEKRRQQMLALILILDSV